MRPTAQSVIMQNGIATAMKTNCNRVVMSFLRGDSQGCGLWLSAQRQRSPGRPQRRGEATKAIVAGSGASPCWAAAAEIMNMSCCLVLNLQTGTAKRNRFMQRKAAHQASHATLCKPSLVTKAFHFREQRSIEREVSAQRHRSPGRPQRHGEATKPTVAGSGASPCWAAASAFMKMFCFLVLEVKREQ